MTEQHPIRRPGQGERRLASISHHFLSEEAVRPAPEQAGTIAIAGWRELPFPTLALAAIMARLGVSCTIREDGQPPIELHPETDTGPPRCRPLRLIIDNASDVDIAENTDLLLLAVPASAAGLRYGFIRLKQCLCARAPSRVGLTLLDCDDPERARRYFGLLRQACRRFLATEISSYGAIAGGHDPGGECPELAGVARLLMEDLGPAETATAGRSRQPGRERHEL